ncbi:hypothetical protein K505DRAFT_323394 [Melanomma pulvis-pyrius CBS 109.77]|uniref:LPXTG-domain-containing protein n=1 Tax=Melanomma pulvis-pyrius CBS 109.77 TaxID=1314802 RepID=A0A6A6XIH3_9PLEO|nr:hypothetical protein K505DRAFT_323394 [Melanomma pulvis-pyrius CBS 109.77]
MARLPKRPRWYPASASPSFSSLLAFFFVVAISKLASAIEVTVDSPCSTFCIDSPSANASDPISSATFSRDLSCLDTDYNGDNSTAVGRKFRTCVVCEQTSSATGKGVEGEGNENDVYWFLFNMKSTIAWCVHGFFGTEQNPNTTLANSLCASDCDPISTALEDRLLQTNETLQYNYCTSDSGAFTKGVDTCAKCLNGVDNLRIMGNFLSALKSACAEKPRPGTTLSLSTTVFNIPTPTPTPSSTPSSSASSSPLPSTTASAAPSSLSSGAKAGIAIAVIGGLALLGAAAFFILRRRRKVTMAQGYELDGRGRDGGVAGGDVKGWGQEMGGPQARPEEMEARSAPVELPGSAVNGGARQRGT